MATPTQPARPAKSIAASGFYRSFFNDAHMLHKLERSRKL
jgi:hypothetical protein